MTSYEDKTTVFFREQSRALVTKWCINGER